MDIFDKTIAKIGRIIGDNRKIYDQGKEEKIPPYLDCDNENELIDAYGGWLHYQKAIRRRQKILCQYGRKHFG